ncbi:MAG TPA: DedA family protein [Bryobacteraceae bacterium]|nr:DedA family protein [Bryobacteraceae bacterium]
MEQQILGWISQYGYAAIFCLLVSGIVGLPVPDETLLTFTGYLIFKGNLSLAPSFAAALAGSLSGITLSYTLGRKFGLPLIHRYGKYLRIREEHLNKAHAWFARAGHWSLTGGYFIAGVRHLTAYAAGMSDVEYPQFALFAYSGGVLWVSTFLSLGYFLGDRWEAVQRTIEHDLRYAALAAAIFVLAAIAWRKLAKRKPVG